ncbi:hypothetical protein L873DRAFT_1662582 [Choiromyces venosus 120613-1]|uniref:PSP1 C-terminal domain-containing protein n=1 Tax=Choiromyces venosus 120613-1 TaxID=1336337 RepID=A0A3N4K4F8_9PEZI|nr:hypothetical protein L873DRAFT_1662582 [Choiromyces venosus 120613-1]
MSDIPSTNTPRLSDISSIDSPRDSLDQTPPAGMSGVNQATTTGGPFNPLGKTSSPSLGDGSNKLRHASPDSDALVSSDDELEQKELSYFSQHKNSALSALSSRRPSYAAEFQNRPRNYSIVGSGPLSPTSSYPSAPQGDTATWAAGISSGSVGPTAGQSLAPIWGSIWNSEPSRKSPPKPLNVQHSAIVPGSTQSPLFVGSEALPSPTSMMPNTGDFPIPIPLQPQLRNYRSMSFSVGQLPRDLDERPRLSPPATGNGPRPHPPSGLQHRPSRPSLLSEEQYAGQSSPLRSVFETEDDDANNAELNRARESSGLHTGYLQQPGGAVTSQQANYIRSRYESMRLRNRSASTASVPLAAGLSSLASIGLNGGRDGERSFPGEEHESALADDDDLDYHHFQAQQADGRRFSEAPQRSMSLMYSPAENQRLENLRRQHWQSAGHFAGLESGSQSRRHSFAGGLPMNDVLEKEYNIAGSELLAKRNVSPPKYGENGLASLANRDNFYLEEARLRQRQTFPVNKAPLPSSITPPGQHHLQQLQQAYTAPTRLPSPPLGISHRGMMSMGSHHAQQPRSQQLLYFVTFKACRGDVFYVQEGTGLRVRTGDLVIVEADRGTDLGTVAAENITWQEAKELKEEHAKEQYTWLMMFATRRAPASGAPPAGGLHNGVNGTGMGFANGGATGAMPGTHGQMQGQDGATAELKPKMIKRLAQVHEIQTLRDKEANEAKAKRVCQQKVLEHRLPMEILDAEFQMDWKKLTFYYFADSYINFNSLVTDLFKVYKTRIWMSAMNPASFAHPAGLHPSGSGPPGTGISSSGPPGSGPPGSGALGAIGESNELQNQIMHQSQYSGLNASYPGYVHSNGSGSSMMSHRGQQISGNFPPRNSPHTSVAPHQDFSHLPQQLNGYNNAPYMNGNSNGHQSQNMGNNLDNHSNGGNDAWMASLQGLSRLSLE